MVGLGTVISSWTDVEYRGWDWAVFVTGLIQFGLAWIIIGWAWSIWWGVRMYADAQERKRREEDQPVQNVSTNQEAQPILSNDREEHFVHPSMNSDQEAV